MRVEDVVIKAWNPCPTITRKKKRSRMFHKRDAEDEEEENEKVVEMEDGMSGRIWIGMDEKNLSLRMGFVLGSLILNIRDFMEFFVV